MDLDKVQFFREDGRYVNEIRNLKFNMGALDGASGSSLYESGNTKIIASVFGPKEDFSLEFNNDPIPLNFNFCIQWLPFAKQNYQEKQKSQKSLEDTAHILKLLFKSVIIDGYFSNSCIDVNLEIYQYDGGELSCCVNAATLALLNAGILMKNMVVASSACMIAPSRVDGLVNLKNKKLVGVIDPNISEISNHPYVTVVYSGDKLLYFDLDNSKTDFENLEILKEKARIGAALTYEQMKKYVYNEYAIKRCILQNM